MLWRIRWEDLQFESPNKYHKRAGSRLTLSQVEDLDPCTLEINACKKKNNLKKYAGEGTENKHVTDERSSQSQSSCA